MACDGWPKLTEPGPNLTHPGPHSAEFGTTSVDAEPSLADSGTTWPMLAEVAPTVPEFDGFRPVSAICRPNSTKIRPTMDGCDRMRPYLRKHRPASQGFAQPSFRNATRATQCINFDVQSQLQSCACHDGCCCCSLSNLGNAWKANSIGDAQVGVRRMGPKSVHIRAL